jgi:hypothetical protein
MIIFYSSFHAGNSMYNKISAAVAVTLLAGCTTIPTVEEATVFDATTTAVGLSRGATELNPIGPVGTVLFKLLYINGMFGPRTEHSDRAASAAWTGAAANNITQLLIPGNLLFSLTVGGIVGYYIYTMPKQPEK